MFFLLDRMHNSKNHEHHCSRVVVLKQFLSKKTSSHKNIHVRSAQKIDDGFAALGEGNGNPLLYSGLENSMDRGAL